MTMTLPGRSAPRGAVRAARRAAAFLLPLLGAPIAAAGAQAVAELELQPAALTLGVGDRKQVVATAYDRQGAIIVSAAIALHASDTTIVRVSRDGVVTALRPGTARVEARAAGRTSVATVTVAGAPRPAPRPASTLVVAPASVSLVPSERLVLTARAVREDGVAAEAPSVSWRSLRPEIAAVDDQGVVVGVAAGETVVQASGPGGLAATVPVVVAAADIAISTSRLSLAPGDVDTLRVTVPAQNGRQVGARLRWLSSDTTVARVTAEGVVVAAGQGVAEIVVIGLGQERRARIAVHRRPESFVVSPRPSAGPVQLPVGGRTALVARGDAADGTAIPEAEVTWETSDSTLVAIEPASGMVTGLRTGEATVTARLAGFESATWSLTVVPAGVAVDKERWSLAVGARGRLAARLVDDRGETVPGAVEVQWTSDRPDIASVSADGTVEGNGFGRARVTASAPWGRRATSEVLVTGDMLVASDRAGSGHGIYQLRTAAPDLLGVVLADSGSSVQPAVSPDRTRIAFSSNRAGTFDLYAMDADGRNVTRLTSDAGHEGEPAWTPDGRRIIYTASSAGVSRIASIAADGTDPRMLVSVGASAAPTVSPDGAAIAYVSARDGSYDLYVADSAGANERRITVTTDREASPRFAADGKLLYVVHRGARGSTIVRRAPLSATTIETLVESPDAILSLAVAPDGGRIAWVSGRITDRSRNRSEYRLVVQPAARGAAPVAVPLRPGEQVASPAF